MSQKNGLSRIHWRTPTAILAGFILGAGFCAAHHFFYRYLDGRIVDEVRLGQSQNSAVGNAFSFLVRAFLVMSIASTFWQVFWSKLHDKPITVYEIDALHGLLVRLEEFRHISALKTVPNLALLALLSWLMPFAIVFPPSALSVKSQYEIRPEFHSLGTPDWNDPDLILVSNRGGTYQGPSRWLQRLMFATAYGGQVLHIETIAENASHSLSFFGPAVRCHSEEPAAYIEALQIATGGCLEQLSGCGSGKLDYRFISWIPNQYSAVPFEAGTILGALPEPLNLHTAVDGGTPSLFVAYLSDISEDWQIQQCQLHNTSYEYEFSFHNSNQSVNVTKMDDLGALVTDGPIESNSRSFISYTAVFETLAQILVGTIYSESGIDGYHVNDTTVLETQLEYSIELIPIAQAVSPTYYTDIANNIGTLGNLITALMSYHMIPSLFFDPNLLTKPGELTQVNRNLHFNVYAYNSARLLVPYGAALAMAGIAVMIGSIHLITDGASYSNRFSTVLRTTRQEQLDHLIGPADREGQDPIPQHLAKWRLRVGQGDHGQPDEMAMELLSNGDRDEAGLKSATAVTTGRPHA